MRIRIADRTRQFGLCPSCYFIFRLGALFGSLLIAGLGIASSYLSQVK